ncbi:hypothetical protein PHYPSEUDO_007292 [Phytophthora pseudosyringae]|uniref:Uncharacterized protein n=1 Tax=Phytophthora pseudosyringae TaxID=221518 RepID=A0A8T1VJE3_9STRA|nr:hypothetical protein PHYPSEUDO_007292 [Phytophthora pseudosyringae]
MKVDGPFLRMRTLAEMTRAALKIWQFVAKYTTKPLLCQGVEGDMAMANNSRRKSFADESLPTKKDGADKGEHIAFDDMCKLIKPDKAALYTPPTPQRVQVVALANWESAPTFVLDEHLGKGFPKASTDHLLNKCNPFLSGKCRANSEDVASEAPTVSTNCSTIPENDVEELDIVEEEADKKESAALEEETCETQIEQVPIECESTVADQLESKPVQESGVDEAEPKKQTPRWVCVGHGRWIKCNGVQASTVSSSPQTENSWAVRWVQVGYGRYTKFYVNGEAGDQVAA